MQKWRVGFRLFMATIAMVLFSSMLAAPAHSNVNPPVTGPTYINPGHKLTPGYNVTPYVGNVDYTKGLLKLHYFGKTYSFQGNMDFYRFFAQVPTTTKSGTYRIWATQNGATIAQHWAYVHPLRPQISPSSWYLHAGEQLKFNGSGFRPGETARLFADGVDTGKSVPVGWSTPFYYDIQGDLPGQYPYPPSSTLTFTIPETMKGHTCRFEIRGSQSGVSAQVWVTVAGW